MRQRRENGCARCRLARYCAGSCAGPALLLWAGINFLWSYENSDGECGYRYCGGMDSMSQGELYIPGDIKWGLGGKNHEKYGFMPRGHGALAMWGIPFYDRIQRARVMSQPIPRYGELTSMMAWAEAAARNEKISRSQADQWALRSHKKAIAAQDAGLFAGEIVPISLGKDNSGEITYLKTDDGPRRETTLEK